MTTRNRTTRNRAARAMLWAARKLQLLAVDLRGDLGDLPAAVDRGMARARKLWLDAVFADLGAIGPRVHIARCVDLEEVVLHVGADDLVADIVHDIPETVAAMVRDRLADGEEPDAIDQYYMRAHETEIAGASAGVAGTTVAQTTTLVCATTARRSMMSRSPRRPRRPRRAAAGSSRRARSGSPTQLGSAATTAPTLRPSGSTPSTAARRQG